MYPEVVSSRTLEHDGYLFALTEALRIDRVGSTVIRGI
jgi:hypothetical protein